MAKLPGEMDYGARKSVRSNRLDMPGQEDVIIAEAVERAASAFGEVLGRAGQKTDALTYSKAKSDLLSADIRIRRELNEAGDWENYQDHYREQINEVLGPITTTISDPSDREVFSADANVTVERGVSAMSQIQRQRRGEHEMAATMDMLDDRRREILADETDQGTRVDMLLTTQEYVRDQVRAGNIAPDVGERMIKSFVADVAQAELMAMPLRTRAALLEASIAANQDPEAEDFKGTGSLADFMHQDERVELLRKTENLLKSEEDLGIAQDTADEAVNLYRAPTADNYRARREHVKNSDLSPEQRRLSMQEIEAAEMADRRIKSDEQDEVIKSAQQNIRIGAGQGDPDDPKSRVPYTTSMIPREDWDKLSAGQQGRLTQYADAMQQGRSHALTTQMTKIADDDGSEMPSYSLWRRLTDEQKLQVDLDSPMWLMGFNEQDWRGLKLQQEQLGKGQGMSYDDGLTNDQMLLSALIAGGWVPKTGQNVEEQERFARARLEYDRRIQDEMRRQGVGELSNPERRKILAEVLTTQGYLDRDFVFSDYDEDEAMPAFMMNPEQLDRAHKNLDDADTEFITLSTGDDMSIHKMLVAQAMNSPDDPDYPGLGLQKEPSRKDLERAYFAYKAKLGVDEINRRLRGE